MASEFQRVELMTPIDQYFWQAIKVQKFRFFIQTKNRINSLEWLNLKLFMKIK
jgi:hypothetical protein